MDKKSFLTTVTPKECAVCGELVNCIDIYSESPICSEECLKKFDTKLLAIEPNY